MKKYFLHDGSQQLGPFDIEEIKSKNLNRDTPIWYEGLEEWTTVSKVDEINEKIKVTPPPFAAKSASLPIVEKAMIEQKAFVDNPKRSSSMTRSVLMIAGLIVITLVGLFIYNRIQHQQYQQNREQTINSEEDRKTLIKNSITSFVTAERNEYTYNELGGISNLKISVSNNTDYVLDNVKVKIVYIKANGKVWDSKIIDFNMIDPQTKSTIKVGDTDRGTSVQYEIVSIKSNALELN